MPNTGTPPRAGRCRACRRAGGIDGRRATGEHDGDRISGEETLERFVVRDELRVVAGLTDTARDQLRVLGAVVDDEDRTGGRVRIRLPRGIDSIAASVIGIGATVRSG
jgi:hypothetical protein